MFAMIVIASYTANLAAFLTVETLEKPISSAEDLERQDVIKYGVVNGGSTAKFFQTSANPVYQRMGEFMNSKWTNPNTSITSVQVLWFDSFIYLNTKLHFYFIIRIKEINRLEADLFFVHGFRGVVREKHKRGRKLVAEQQISL